MFKRAFLAAAVAVAVSSSAHAQSVLLSESFDNVAALASSGWVLNNLSTPVGPTGWFQGNSTVFSAQAGAPTAYIAANYNNALAGGTIADYLISPTFSTAVAGTVSFYVRADILAPYVDSFSFGLGTSASSAASSFTSMVSVTPVAGTWTKYTMSFAAQGAGSVGRFAFEYFGPADTSNYIGIDTFSVTAAAAVPETATWLAMSVGLAGVGFVARRKA